MNNQNKKVMSIAIDPLLHDELKKYAKRRGQSASSYVQSLIEKALKIDVDEEPMVIGKPVDESILPVVLKIPAALKGDLDGLKAWMEAKVGGIISKLSGE
jgi:hypothetical protein